MFSVIFEVQPRGEEWEAYLDNAKMLRPELEQIDGFVDNIRYRSLQRDGWLLSLSGWRDEKSVVRWRTRMRHHLVQEKGRSQILSDYHLRVGQITADTRVPQGHVLAEQRLDETEVGEGTAIVLIDAKRSNAGDALDANECAQWLGFDPWCSGCLSWDVFDAVLTPGDLILLVSWRDQASAADFADKLVLREEARLRRVRVIRDYGMFDRREAPQYYPEVERAQATV